MYKPLFNKVLVEIDDKESNWGKGTDTNLGGEVYREGKVLETGMLVDTPDYNTIAIDMVGWLSGLTGKQIMWNEGHEAGTIFEENSKKYALIYWFDIVGIRDDK